MTPTRVPIILRTGKHVTVRHADILPLLPYIAGLTPPPMPTLPAFDRAIDRASLIRAISEYRPILPTSTPSRN